MTRFARDLRHHIGRWDQSVDSASATAFRCAFGLLMCMAVVRFAAMGWIDEFYIAPQYTFAYYGFEWVPRPGANGMYVLFSALGISALLVAFGVLYRPAIIVFAVGFTWLELLEKSLYLNHYVLITILAWLMVLMPLSREQLRAGVPRWVLWTLRLQLGLVYVFAGIAKLQADWLLEAQPLRVWLARESLPGFDTSVMAYTMSWAGAFFDCTIPLWLSWRPSRRWAYLAVVAFHAVTGWLFNIGMFPVVMVALTPIFFSPDWPRRLPGGRWLSAPSLNVKPRSTPRVLAAILGVHFCVQLLVPLRHHLYPGDTLWTEEGFRFSWHVMIVEKAGDLTLTVLHPPSGRRWEVTPQSRLTPVQAKQVSMQADMVLQFAQLVEQEFRTRGISPVEIRAECWVSYNGRPRAQLIDSAVDLTQVSEHLSPKPWILPAPPPAP